MSKLFNEFHPTTASAWKDKLAKDLKGTDFEQLIWKTENQINVNPFYTKEDLNELKAPVFSHHDWDICEHIIVTDENASNKMALKALEGGASGLIFFIPSKINTAVLLKNISVEHIYTQFFITNESLHVLEDLKNIYGKLNPSEQKLKCFVHIDPLTWYAFNGGWTKNEKDDLAVLKQLVHIPVNGSLYQEAGANTINELAITLSHLNEYLNYLDEQKILKQQTIHLTLSVNSDFFNEIAKLRAVKKLVQLLLKQYNVDLPLHLHVQTTQTNCSSLDSNNNMLRSTTEAMSAVLGGCNSLLIFPYDFIYEQPTEFSNRMARNQQHILKEESYLNKIADISAGSYYIETLTENIAEKAWEQFKTIEKEGGFIASLKSNFIQNLISKDFSSIKEKIQSGETTLIGVNKFQNKTEKIKLSANLPDPEKSDIKAIRPIRYSLIFEKEFAQKEKTNS